MLTNTRETYGLVAQILHWITAALILVLLPLGAYMHELPDGTAAEVADKLWLYSLHKTLGITVFFVALARIAWALTQKHPHLLNAEKRLESLAAQTVHWMLYGSIVLVPLTGWLHHAAETGFAPIWWPFGQELPFVPDSPALASLFGLAHDVAGKLLAISLILHIAGALKHAIIDRDDTLKRMIPGAYSARGHSFQQASGQRLSRGLAVLAFLAAGGLVAGVYAAGGGPQPTTAPQPAAAQPAAGTETGSWIIDREKSTLAIEIIQNGAPVAGQFNTWNAEIDFDPDALESARVNATVDVGSLSLGSVTGQAVSKDFLNAPEHPQAVFRSSEFLKTEGENAYEARGELTLAGVTAPLTLPFTLRIENGRAFMTGETVINRIAYGVGKQGFPDESNVGFPVTVKVTIEAERREGSSGS